MSVPLRLCVVAAPGEFVMGENARDKFANDTERPAHRVRFTHGVALGKFPVTVAEYRVFAPEHAPEDDAEWPVVNVTWSEARDFCSWLGEENGRICRLPNEAEWEYACRAGSQGPFSTGDELTESEANFLFSEYGIRVGPGQRTRVGNYPANAFGLHDLHGNVCEWMEDAWHPNYVGAPTDGSAWAGEDTRRVIRGGAWDYLPRLLRSAWRDALGEDEQRDNLGFRYACELEGDEK